jgi:hypothetical protein
MGLRRLCLDDGAYGRYFSKKVSDECPTTRSLSGQHVSNEKCDWISLAMAGVRELR